MNLNAEQLKAACAALNYLQVDPTYEDHLPVIRAIIFLVANEPDMLMVGLAIMKENEFLRDLGDKKQFRETFGQDGKKFIEMIKGRAVVGPREEKS